MGGIRPAKARAPWVGSDVGENNTASNVGGGCGIFKQKVGVDLQFKSLDDGYGIDIGCGTDLVTVSVGIDVVPLVDAATIVVDASLGQVFEITLGGNRVMGNPSNAVDGRKIIFRVYQDGTGGRTLSWDTNYRFSTDLPQPTLSTAIGALDYFGFMYNGTASKWDYLAEVKGF